MGRYLTKGGDTGCMWLKQIRIISFDPFCGKNMPKSRSLWQLILQPSSIRKTALVRLIEIVIQNFSYFAAVDQPLDHAFYLSCFASSRHFYLCMPVQWRAPSRQWVETWLMEILRIPLVIIFETITQWFFRLCRLSEDCAGLQACYHLINPNCR